MAATGKENIIVQRLYLLFKWEPGVKDSLLYLRKHLASRVRDGLFLDDSSTRQTRT